MMQRMRLRYHSASVAALELKYMKEGYSSEIYIYICMCVYIVSIIESDIWPHHMALSSTWWVQHNRRALLGTQQSVASVCHN